MTSHRITSPLPALGPADQARLSAVHETLKAARAPRPRVAVVASLDPVRGAGQWVTDLVRRAGGINALAASGADSVVIDVDAIRGATPELVLFVPAGYDLRRAASESEALLATPAWGWASGIEAWVLDASLVTDHRVADAVETIASIVAPALFSEPPHGCACRLTRSAP